MESSIVAFKFHESEIRTLGSPDDLWFLNQDVCTVLEYNDPARVVRKLHDDEKKLIRLDVGSGQARKYWCINESGLYTLILRSEKPKADEFRRWITHEVLPSIRKTGHYGHDTCMDKLVELKSKADIIEGEITQQKAKLKELDGQYRENIQHILNLIGQNPMQLNLEI